MYTLIIFIPLLSAIVAGFFGRFIGEKGAAIYTTVSICIASCLAWLILYEVGIKGAPTYIKLWTWIESSTMEVPAGLQFDAVTATMLILVTTVSALVHLYSTGYMLGDPHLPRFMSYLSLFTFFMILLVTGDNLLQLFIGWEGVGLCSYLLINFWFTRIQANKSAIKAMVVNRVGDIGLALGMILTYTVFKSLNYSVIFSTVHLVESNNIITIIGLLLLVGAVGKSAQLGLHTWLPDAMEGPTPVSALIHAATMVTAGVFLLIRCGPLLEYSPKALTVIAIIGALTAFFAASVGLVQNDIKKVIAYSTCSQLGYMVLACGLSNYSVSLFHLVNHGFFKALLFLSAGSVIHAMADEQDMRKLGGLIRAIPFTYTMILIGSLSLMGFPFMTGYYSKDAILELAYAKFTIDAVFGYWLGTLGALFTAFYSFRLIYLTFLTETNAPQSPNTRAHESPWNMSLPLGILAIGSIFIGYLFKDAFIGLGSSFFSNATLTKVADSAIEAEFALSPLVKGIPFIFSMCGAICALIIYSFGITKRAIVPHYSPRVTVQSVYLQSRRVESPVYGQSFMTKGHEPLNSLDYAHNIQATLGVAHSVSLNQHPGVSEEALKVSRVSGLRNNIPVVSPLNTVVSGYNFSTVYTFLNNKWHWDAVYNSYLVKPLFFFGHVVSYKLLDRGCVEYLGPLGIGNLITRFSTLLSKVQSGSVTNYAFIIFVFSTLFLFFAYYFPTTYIALDLLLVLPLVFPAMWLDKSQI